MLKESYRTLVELGGIPWASTHALLLARSHYLCGRIADAERLLDLAYALRTADKHAEARTALEDALTRYRAKGDVVSTAKTERLLVEL